jgi:hypothetical protein
LNKHDWTVIGLRLQADHLRQAALLLETYWPDKDTRVIDRLLRRAEWLDARAARLQARG